MKLIEKIAKIQQEVSVQKSWNNPFFKSKYITLDDILAKLNPLLITNKVAVIHENIEWWVVTEIHDLESEDKLSSLFVINWVTDPQKMWAVISYGRRYNLVSLFNIIADEDDDWNSFYKKSLFWQTEFDRLVKNKDKYVDALSVMWVLDDKYDVTPKREQKIQDLYKL